MASAELSHQPLRHDSGYRGCNQVVLNPEIKQTDDGGNTVIGVERRKDEMAGLRSLHSNFGGLQVADLPHHDDVWILPQDGAQRAGEGEPGTRVYMHLVDAGQRIYDRI